jgi:hypothetical protein
LRVGCVRDGASLTATGRQGCAGGAAGVVGSARIRSGSPHTTQRLRQLSSETRRTRKTYIGCIRCASHVTPRVHVFGVHYRNYRECTGAGNYLDEALAVGRSVALQHVVAKVGGDGGDPKHEAAQDHQIKHQQVNAHRAAGHGAARLLAGHLVRRAQARQHRRNQQHGNEHRAQRCAARRRTAVPSAPRPSIGGLPLG